METKAGLMEQRRTTRVIERGKNGRPRQVRKRPALHASAEAGLFQRRGKAEKTGRLRSGVTKLQRAAVGKSLSGGRGMGKNAHKDTCETRRIVVNWGKANSP